MLAHSGTLLHQAERGPALFVQGNNFAVQHRTFCFDRRCQIVQFRILPGQIVLVA